MKKIAISLIALAAVSTAAFAGSNRSYDLRDAPDYVGAYAAQATGNNKSEFAMAVGSSQTPTLAEIIVRNQEKNLSGH